VYILENPPLKVRKNNCGCQLGENMTRGKKGGICERKKRKYKTKDKMEIKVYK
jgi:hypothetical protein